MIIAQHFSAGIRVAMEMSLCGTKEIGDRRFCRPCGTCDFIMLEPSTEVLGNFRASLRDSELWRCGGVRKTSCVRESAKIFVALRACESAVAAALCRRSTK